MVNTVAAQSVTVFTDRGAWETAAAAFPVFFPMYQDFEALTPGIMSSGRNEFWSNPFGFFIVEIDGVPGFNSIEDGSINPSIAPLLSPNGSTFYLGEVSDVTHPQFLFQPFAAPPIANGFGADWVVLEPGLSMEVLDTTIDFDTYLPTGSGFLGVISTDVFGAANPVLFNTPNPIQLFGMDNLAFASIVPLPPAVWLFGSGLLGLIGISRRKKTA
jgi:hypothetical protein